MSAGARFIVFAVALALVAADAGPASAERVPLLEVDRGGVTFAAEVQPGGKHVTFYGSNLCLVRQGRIRVSRVDLIDPVGGAVVSDFTIVRGWNGMRGFWAKRLSKIRSISHGSDRLRGWCGRADHAFWVLYVHLTKPAAAEAAGGKGLRITYRNGHGQRRVRSSTGLYVCEDLDGQLCDETTAGGT
ncbi:MAG: hypothetical protein M3237_08945 [Actinomycetota bacterium]|nr:hypothetical protein [Actinomycetota bacterium]